jgi:hypothetical protein
MTLKRDHKKIAIVLPVFNDWQAFGRVLEQSVLQPMQLAA